MKGYVLIISIDPGKTGGVCSMLYNRKKNHVASVTAVKMPEELVDLNNYLQWLVQDRPHEGYVIYIEKLQLMHGDLKGGKAFRIQKMLQGYEQMIGALKTKGYHYVEVMPRTWQKQFLEKTIKERSERKNALKKIASEKYPHIKMNLAISDAICILEYGRQQVIINPNLCHTISTQR